MPYKSLINGSKEDFNSLVSTFWLINNALNDLSFSIELGKPIGEYNSADFKKIYTLNVIPAAGLLQVGLRESAYSHFSFKLEDVEGYYYEKIMEKLNFSLYLKNDIRITILRDKYSKVSSIDIATKSAGFMYDTWKKE